VQSSLDLPDAGSHIIVDNGDLVDLSLSWNLFGK